MSDREHLTSTDRTVLSVIYEHFARYGKWPLTRELRKVLSPIALLEDVVSDLGTDLIVCNFNLNDKYAACRLQPLALAFIEAAEPDRQRILKAVEYFAQRYIASTEHPLIISTYELVENAMMRTDDFVQRRHDYRAASVNLLVGDSHAPSPEKSGDDQLLMRRESLTLVGWRRFVLPVVISVVATVVGGLILALLL